ncbi:unnamed protein product [Adineta steineri]|uniref:Uncharacterized protein n=1 Tax=Adineta steineri TaxID=433720 RepID=A0A819J211_9BILA|nr:unnamed protein product [Adineta steineri]
MKWIKENTILLDFIGDSLYLRHSLSNKYISEKKMRPAYAGPGSGSPRWKPTQDPGKTSPSSNTSVNRSNGNDVNSATSKVGNTQQNQQHAEDEQKKE